MGTAVIIDILGSMVIGGILLLILFQMNDNATQNTYNFSGELVMQQNLVTTVEVLEYDFRKIGYCEDPTKLPNPELNAIRYADASHIKFYTDVMISPYNDPNGDGSIDSIEYKLGPASELSGTPNPDDKILYRIVNGVSRGVNLGITEFKIKYFTDKLINGNVTLAEIPSSELPLTYTEGHPTGITAMEIDIKVENTSAYNAGQNPYRTAFWRQIKLSSRNIQR
jgi:hypothetical protein